MLFPHRHRKAIFLFLIPSTDGASWERPFTSTDKRSILERFGRRDIEPRDLRENHRPQRQLRLGDSGDLRPAFGPRLRRPCTSGSRSRTSIVCATGRESRPASAWSAVPALDRSGIQGGAWHQSVPAVTCFDGQDLPVPGAEVHVRFHPGGTGARRFSGPGGAQQPGVAVHVGSDVAAGLRALDAAIEKTPA